MFIDDYGNEFETVEEIENFARKEFDNMNADDLTNIMEYWFSNEELLKWILKNDKEKFIKEHISMFKFAKHGYVRDYFIVHDIEEI